MGCHRNHAISHSPNQNFFKDTFVSHPGGPNEQFGTHEKLSWGVQGNLNWMPGYVTFPCGVLGQVWYLIVLIPDFYRLPLMLSLSDNIQADFVEAFNSASRYLDVLLNVDYPYFDQMVRQIYPTELELNKAFF